MSMEKGCVVRFAAKKKPCCLGVGEQGFLGKLAFGGLMGCQSTLLAISLCWETPILCWIGGHKAMIQYRTHDRSPTLGQRG
jgi:hypothetical protein